MTGTATDFWTSGNTLGTNTWLWLSNGSPFNGTFNYWPNGKEPLRSVTLATKSSFFNVPPPPFLPVPPRSFPFLPVTSLPLIKSPSRMWRPIDGAATSAA